LCIKNSIQRQLCSTVMIESSDETAPTHNNENTAADTNGKRDEKILSFFQPTTTSLSEKRLAQTLGYPATWHVVRTFLPKTTYKHFATESMLVHPPPTQIPTTIMAQPWLLHYVGLKARAHHMIMKEVK